MEILEQFSTEIAIVVTITALGAIYLIIKKFQKSTISESTEKKEPEKLTQKTQEQEEVSQVAISRTKRALPQHDKITKDDFSSFKNIRILIAEDNIINQKVLIALLGNSGIDMVIANNGQEVLDILNSNSDFSLILMDVHMPIMDGIQATKAIRKNQNYNHIAIIALSGDSAPDDIKNMLSSGMDAHIEKPIKMDSLYNILFTYTTGSEQKAEHNSFVELDSKKGLEISGYDRDFYIEILDEFVSKYSKSDFTIQEYLRDSNTLDADKLLLDISGVSANIGANNLHDIAIELKRSIANPNDLEYISNLKKYQRILAKVCSEIAEYKKA